MSCWNPDSLFWKEKKIYAYLSSVPLSHRSWCPIDKSWQWRGRSYKQNWSTSGSVWHCHRHTGREALITKATLQGDPNTQIQWHPGPSHRPSRLRLRVYFSTAWSLWLHEGEYGWLGKIKEKNKKWTQWMSRQVNAQKTGAFSEGQLVFGLSGSAPEATNACQCSQPEISEAGDPEYQHTPTCFPPPISCSCCSVVQPLHPSAPQLHRQSCQWRSSFPWRGFCHMTWKLHAKASSQSGLIFLPAATRALELEMHLRIKAEELPGGTVLQQRTIWITEELRKCTLFFFFFGKN